MIVALSMVASLELLYAQSVGQAAFGALLLGVLGALVAWTSPQRLVYIPLGFLLMFGRVLWMEQPLKIDHNQNYVVISYVKSRGRMQEFRCGRCRIAFDGWKLTPKTKGSFAKGALYRFSGDLIPIPRNPSGFLYEATNVRCLEPVFLEGGRPTVRWRLEESKKQLTLRYMAAFGSEAGSLSASLVLGTRAAPVETRRGVLRALGLLHLLSISGFHINLLEGFFKRLGLGKKTLLFLIPYGIYLNALPVLRAVWMKSVRELAFGLRVDASGFVQLLVTAVCMLLVEPTRLFDASFQLTFLATLGIVSFAPLLAEEFHWIQPPALRSTIVLTLSVSMLCAPVLAQFSASFNAGLLLCNLFLVPLYSLYCLLSFLALGAILSGCSLLIIPFRGALDLLLRVMTLLESSLVHGAIWPVPWTLLEGGLPAFLLCYGLSHAKAPFKDKVKTLLIGGAMLWILLRLRFDGCHARYLQALGILLI
ncbi:hypothetical protein ABB02_02049 [Clostridiaceae bacterium JG1575]|nr:hypothetical protein ABB02_02049 [Clostridiaceae bacterium JG1575]